VQATEIPGNLFLKNASKGMSSLSGAQFHAETPVAPETAGLRELELLRKAQRGQREAFGQLVLLYQDRLYNAVLRLVGDREEARELTQEAFTRGFMKLESFRGDASPYTWLFRKIKRHRTFSLDAGSNGNGRHSTDDQASSLVDRLASQNTARPSETLEDREQGEQVLAALGRLDAEYRAVLVMRDIEGFDYQQMAEVLDLPLGTLKSRLFRARLALRDELRPYLSGARS